MTWYVVDKFIVRYDKGEWLNFESGDDYLILAKFVPQERAYSRFAIFDNKGNRLLYCNTELRDYSDNISYDWGTLGLNLDIIPIPDISGLSIINLDFEFYDSTSNIKKIDNKFIDIPTIAQEAATLIDTALLSILGDGVIE